MDVNLLALNVGNSRLAIGTFVDGELAHVVRAPLADRAGWESMLTQAWMPIAKHDNAAVVIASVNPSVAEALELAASRATNTDLEWIGREIDLPLKVKTDDPKLTGVDRVLNVAAAYEQLGKGCVVVDAGSAITIDCCNDAGEFLGGSISPGVNMQLDALHEKTARLPRVNFARPSGAVGSSTESAILHGVFDGVRGLVRERVENFATALGYWPDVIATGGDSLLLFEGWELIHAVSPDLTLYGIALAYAEHKIRNES